MSENRGEVRLYPNDPAKRTGDLRCVGGSMSDAFNDSVVHSVLDILQAKNPDPLGNVQKYEAALGALHGISPQDEVEGMLAAQLVATNLAAMDCYRRAMIRDQGFDSRREHLSQGGKLSRTYATLLEALDRHRGKGSQQRVVVEHVHVHAGGNAIVGAVEAGGGGKREKRRLPHATRPIDAAQPAVRGEDQEGDPMPLACDAKRPLPHARRKVAGRAARA